MPSIDKYSIDLLSAVSRIISKNNIEAYLIGGFIRDILLNRDTNDIDIAVKDRSLETAEILAKELKGKYVLLDAKNKVARVVVQKNNKQLYVDISSFSNSIEQDLARRDFTINAMAIKMGKQIIQLTNIIDPYNGKTDISLHIIKATNEDIFKSDPSRLLRAVRLSSTLDFSIEPGTKKLIIKYRELAKNIPGEKIREELLEILSVPNTYETIRNLDKLELLTTIIPELSDLKNVSQPGMHHWDVFNHCVETVAAAGFLLRENQWRYNIGHLLAHIPWTEAIIEHFNKNIAGDSNRRQILKLAGLFHDIGKPACKTTDGTGRIRFLGHGKLGAKMAETIMNRLRFSGSEIKAAQVMIYYHLRPAQMSTERFPTSHAIFRYFRDTQDYGIDILYLALADYLATQGPNLDIEDWRYHNELTAYILNEHQKQEKKSKQVKLINGNDLISIFGLSPGPLVGKLLAQVYEAQITGKINTREQAFKLINYKLNKEDRD